MMKTSAVTMTHVISHYKEYSPREWATRNSGFLNARKKLNATFLELERIRNGKKVIDLCMIKSHPSLLYADDRDRLFLEPEYHNLASYLQPY